MLHQLHNVLDVVRDHLSRGARRIATRPVTGEAEEFLVSLSEAEGEIIDSIGAGSVRRNQLDSVATALQAVRLLKKFRFGGDPESRRETALSGFLARNEEVSRPSDQSLLRKQLLVRMCKLLERVLPPPYDIRFSSGAMEVGSQVYWPASVPIENRYRSVWVPQCEPLWKPRFGKGAVAESIPYLHRWEMTDGSDPLLEAIRFNEHSRIRSLVPASGISRAVAVPKDVFKDRLITVEPVCSTFLQHGIRRMVYESIHLGKLRWTAMDVVHCEDAQVINRRYALTGSRDSTVATIDLSDASDRIRYDDVMAVMPAWLTELLALSRSTHCDVDGKVVELSMFAGMGNAVTFVVETLMFWAAAMSARLINGLGCKVCSVYGDDVVLDDDSVPLALDAFEALGWVVNRKKSFWGSCPFRESCGIWAWNGTVITPVRFDGYDLSTPGGVAGFRDTMSLLVNSRIGLNQILADRLMKVAGPFVPVSTLDIPGSHVVFDKYGMWRNNHSRIRTRINRDTQSLEAKVDCTSPVTIAVPADRIGYLYGSLAGCIHTDVQRTARGQFVNHVIRLPVPHRQTTRQRWLPARLPSGDRTSIADAHPKGSVRQVAQQDHSTGCAVDGAY